MPLLHETKTAYFKRRITRCDRMTQALGRNTVQYTIALIGQKLLAFLYTVAVARFLGVEGNGQYFFAINFVVIFSVLSDLGISTVFIREGTQKPQELQSLFSQSLSLKILFGVAMVALVNIVAAILHYSPDVRMLMAIASISFVFEAFHVLFFSALRTIQLLKYEALVLFLGQVIQVTFGGILLYFAPNAVVLALALLLANTWNVIVAFLLVRKKLGLKATLSFDTKVLLRFMQMAVPFAIAAIFIKLYSYFDSVLLSKMASKESLGYYGVAYKFTYAFQFIPLAFIAGLFPAFADLHGKGKELIVRLLFRAEWYMAIVGFPLVFGTWALGDRIILAFYGKPYEPAIPTLLILIPVLLFLFLDFPIGSLLNATHHQNIKVKLGGLTVLINIIANLIFVPMFAERGSAIAALLSFSFLYFSGFIVAWRRFSFPVWDFVRMIGKIAVASSVMYLLVVMVKQYIPLIPAIALGALSYTGSLFAVGAVKKEDLSAFRDLFRKRSGVPTPSEETAV